MRRSRERSKGLFKANAVKDDGEEEEVVVDLLTSKE